MNRSKGGQEWSSYYRACLLHPEAVMRLERLLDGVQSDPISVRQATDALAGHGTTYDQVARILDALRAVGALRSATTDAYLVDDVAYPATRSQREGVRVALSWASTQTDRGECELLVAAPADAGTMICERYATAFLDLRTTVRSLIAQSTSQVLLAAPYWDPQVASELAEILRRRQEDGGRVQILCRQPHPGSQNEHALTAIRQVLPPSPVCEIRVLENPSRDDPFGTSTFHFKAACVDDAHVYIGSANFNTASLNSRWELGVRLSGRQALNIAQLLHELWSVARPF